MAAGLEGLFDALGGGVVGSMWRALETSEAEAASFSSREVDAGEDEVGGGVGVEFDGGLGFGAGFVGGGALFADLGEAGVGGGALGSEVMADWNSCSASGRRPWLR